MPIEASGIDGLHLVTWPTHDDERGFFRQTHQLTELRQAVGREVRFVQSNHARSRPGVLRGFHAEPWDKLIYVTRGTAFAAVADIRPTSPTFAHVETFHLGDPPGERVGLFVAEGLANAYCVVGDTEVDYVYEVSEEWRPGDHPAVRFDDADLDVAWPVTTPVVSDADRRNPTLREAFPGHAHFGRR